MNIIIDYLDINDTAVNPASNKERNTQLYLQTVGSELL